MRVKAWVCVKRQVSNSHNKIKRNAMRRYLRMLQIRASYRASASCSAPWLSGVYRYCRTDEALNSQIWIGVVGTKKAKGSRS